ncbi:urate oxidase [Mumia flava]|uniref:Uricase n=1 Tax=Mumia flava TaxID=1348852 RepID=A0A0B2BF29_9ACTN|nr:urate oxidase [Mumia flava]PJJ58218.1 urate oxidase [Mumia flava]
MPVSQTDPTSAPSEPAAGYRLGANRYGKAEVRLVRVDRDTERHTLTDLSVTSQLRGDFADTHTRGDNAHVIATDTQKNTIFAFARDGITSPEAFLLRLAAHFTDDFAWVDGGRWEAHAYGWDRLPSESGAPHDHAFARSGGETRTALVDVDGGRTTVLAGLRDLTVMKSTGSEFVGFPRDRYTTLPEETDRILATSVSARWRYADGVADLDGRGLDGGGLDWDSAYGAARSAMLTAFADTHSKALQETLYVMATAVLDAVPQIAEVRFSMPNKHHFLVDLAPFGLDNPGEVFYAADRPYGLIEAAVLRDGEADGHAVWDSVDGFC